MEQVWKEMEERERSQELEGSGRSWKEVEGGEGRRREEAAGEGRWSEVERRG